jgi:hypothetical protein
MQFSSASCCFLFLGPHYFPSRLILEHLQRMFFLQCKKPSLTPTHNRQQYSSASDSAYYKLFITAGRLGFVMSSSPPQIRNHKML